MNNLIFYFTYMQFYLPNSTVHALPKLKEKKTHLSGSNFAHYFTN